MKSIDIFYRTLAVVVSGFVLGTGAFASSHREAPTISTDPSVDNTDVYAFVSPDAPSTVTLIANYIPFEDPAGAPNFFRFSDDARYTIHVDNIGDAQSHIAYRFTFNTTTGNPNTFLYNVGGISSPTDPNLNVQQTYTITRIDDGAETVVASGLITAPINVGPASIVNYADLAAAAVHELDDGVKVFVGPRDDPFFVDLGAIFDLLTIRPGAPGHQGGGVDGLSGYNCHTIALQIPISQLTNDGTTPVELDDPASVIGVWATASRPSTISRSADADDVASGAFVQVSRLGAPLVNEIVLPLAQKDLWNASQVSEDGQFLAHVTDPEPAALLNLLYGISVPPAPRDDLVQIFLTGVPGLNQPPGVAASEQIRLNVAVAPSIAPNPLGVVGGDLAGFPNGRRLEDDVVDIALRAVAGVLVDGFNVSPNNLLGDGVDQNDRAFSDTFPYVADPHQGFSHRHNRTEPRAAGSPRPKATQAFVTAAVLDETGASVSPDREVQLARSVSGRTPTYNWVGMTDDQGLADIVIAPADGKSPNGLYQARLVDPASGDVLGNWSSIPINGGNRHSVTLQIGRTAKIEKAAATGSFALLDQNVPNPFNPETTIRYRLAEAGNIQLTVFNALGQSVRTLVEGHQSAGDRVVRWDGRDSHGHTVSSGLYFYRLQGNRINEVRRMLLIK